VRVCDYFEALILFLCHEKNYGDEWEGQNPASVLLDAYLYSIAKYDQEPACKQIDRERMLYRPMTFLIERQSAASCVDRIYDNNKALKQAIYYGTVVTRFQVPKLGSYLATFFEETEKLITAPDMFDATFFIGEEKWAPIERILKFMIECTYFPVELTRMLPVLLDGVQKYPDRFQQDAWFGSVLQPKILLQLQAVTKAWEEYKQSK
jgi:hypothetical protein